MYGDRISPWTRNPDMPSAQPGCGSCSGSKTAAPKEYLADTADGGAIILDAKARPICTVGDDDSRPIELDPEETTPDYP
eukprot:CAMPEP_0172711100 /NCGR_PEP_ID=MMETSP1074-20121228/58000_1 /TAXON_ID=2916 /ORGANISM="Ceratium fusus, Strain PA161109" /LENGTH=78 /DNA_ID=CAMNT_0013534677 /DNA_START=212 /DNA_END=448 /DNA_ORIENTATION=+